MTDEERFQALCQPRMERMETDLKEMNKTILGILQGKDGEAGLVDNVRTIMNSRASWGKLGWIVITVLVGQFIILLLSLVPVFFKMRSPVTQGVEVLLSVASKFFHSIT